MKEADLTIKRPDINKITTGYKTFRHIHDKIKRQRDNKRFGEQKKAGSRRDRLTGLRNVDYTLTNVYPITVNKGSATVYNVELGCDRSDTPWCQFLQ